MTQEQIDVEAIRQRAAVAKASYNVVRHSDHLWKIIDGDIPALLDERSEHIERIKQLESERDRLQKQCETFNQAVKPLIMATINSPCILCVDYITSEDIEPCKSCPKVDRPNFRFNFGDKAEGRTER